MIENLKTWWAGHSSAERTQMGVLIGAIFIVILWLGVWRPVTDGLIAGWERQSMALDRYGAVRAQVDALKRAPVPAQAGEHVAVDQMVSQTAAEAGFTLDKIGSAGVGRMSVSIPSARTGALLEWLSRLEASGVGIQTINIVPGTTEGTVAVQVVFQERAR